MTDSILTKLAVVVKDYSAYLKKNLNIFSLPVSVLLVTIIIVYSGEECKGKTVMSN